MVSRRISGLLGCVMSKSLPVPMSFSPPQVWQRSRRVVGVLLAVATLVPMVIVSGVLTVPAEADKLHGLHLHIPVLVAMTVLPILAFWLVALCFLGAERLRYEIADGALKVHTLTSTFRMPLDGVTVQRTQAKLNLRLAGTGLPGLYTGLYLLGDTRARVWATQREGGVVLEGEKRWFVTPDDVDGFLAAARAAGAQVK